MSVNYTWSASKGWGNQGRGNQGKPTPGNLPANLAVANGVDLTDMSSEKKKVKTHECGLIIPDGDRFTLFGGIKMGWPSRRSAQLVCPVSFKTSTPFVMIRLRFPRATGTGASFGSDRSGGPSYHSLDLILYAGTWTLSAEALPEEMLARLPPPEEIFDKELMLLRFKLDEGQKAFVSKFGMPFTARDKRDDEVVNLNKPVDGAMTLIEICDQTEFLILVPALGGAGVKLIHQAQTQFSEAFSGLWFPGFPRLSGVKTIQRHAEAKPFGEVWRFESNYDYAAAIKQGVSHDVYLLGEDVKSIRAKAVQCMVLKATKEEDEVASEFIVLVWHGIKV